MLTVAIALYQKKLLTVSTYDITYQVVINNFRHLYNNLKLNVSKMGRYKSII